MCSKAEGIIWDFFTKDPEFLLQLHNSVGDLLTGMCYTDKSSLFLYGFWILALLIFLLIVGLIYLLILDLMKKVCRKEKMHGTVSDL